MSSIGKSSQNHFKKWLGLIYVFSTIVVILLIVYLEVDWKEMYVPEYPVLMMPDEDESGKLLDLKNFSYVVNSQVCDEKKVSFVLIVTSYAGDVETRSANRRSYSARLLSKFKIQRVFLLALIDDKRNINGISQNAILNENERFHDIIQGNFYEDYRNLTYKHMMGLKWINRYCNQAEYVIKMDHDIIFDFYRLNFLTRKLPSKVDLWLAGYVMSNMKPVREPASKWYVTQEEYPSWTYPSFLSGWFYITTVKTLKRLIAESKNVPYFWIDDVYVTGLLTQMSNATLFKLNKYYTTHPEYLQCCIDKPNYACDYLIGPTSSNNNKLMLNFQKFSKNCFYKMCKKRSEENSLKNTCIAQWKDEPFGKGRAFVSKIGLG